MLLQIKAIFKDFCTLRSYSKYRNKWMSVKLLVAILNRMRTDDSITVIPKKFDQMISDADGFPADNFTKTNTTGVYRKKKGWRH
jgi:hypothetical protein